MSDFTPIETQEDFDKAIKSRLAQKDRELAEKYKDYKSPDDVEAMKADYDKQIKAAQDSLKEAQEKLKGHDTEVSELTKRAELAEKSLLKSKVAIAAKLPIEMADRLVGDTEEDLKKDAETLSGFMGTQGGGTTPPPAKVTPPAGGKDNGMAALLQGINQQLSATN